MKNFNILCLKLVTSLVLFTPFILTAADDKYYGENEGQISNDGYWGGQRGHIGAEELIISNSEPEETDSELFPDYEFVEPTYSNLGFAFAVQSNYDDYNTYSLDFEYVMNDIGEMEGIAWQTNLRQNEKTLIWSNGIGILPEGEENPIGYNVFLDFDARELDGRASFGLKYDDPIYVYSVSSNIYIPLAFSEGKDDIAPSIDVRLEGAMSAVVLFHASAELFDGTNIRVGRGYPTTSGSNKLTVGLDYVPTPIFRIGVEANKVKGHDVGYAAYINFNFDLWGTISEQMEDIVDLDFAIDQQIPFSRSKVMARHQ